MSDPIRNQRPPPSARPRYTIPSLREHLSRPLSDDHIPKTSARAPAPPRNQASSSSSQRPPWATSDGNASDTACNDSDNDGHYYYGQYRPPPAAAPAGRAGGGGARRGGGVRFLGTERMPRADAVFGAQDVSFKFLAHGGPRRHMSVAKSRY